VTHAEFTVTVDGLEVGGVWPFASKPDVAVFVTVVPLANGSAIVHWKVKVTSVPAGTLTASNVIVVTSFVTLVVQSGLLFGFPSLQESAT